MKNLVGFFQWTTMWLFFQVHWNFIVPHCTWLPMIGERGKLKSLHHVVLYNLTSSGHHGNLCSFLDLSNMFCGAKWLFVLFPTKMKITNISSQKKHAIKGDKISPNIMNSWLCIACASFGFGKWFINIDQLLHCIYKMSKSKWGKMIH